MSGFSLNMDCAPFGPLPDQTSNQLLLKDSINLGVCSNFNKHFAFDSHLLDSSYIVPDFHLI